MTLQHLHLHHTIILFQLPSRPTQCHNIVTLATYTTSVHGCIYAYMQGSLVHSRQYAATCGLEMKASRLELPSKIVFTVTVTVLLTFRIFCASSEVTGNDKSDILNEDGVQKDKVQCRQWFYYNTATGHCECFNSSLISCIKQDVFLTFGYCATYSETRGLYPLLCVLTFSRLATM